MKELQKSYDDLMNEKKKVENDLHKLEMNNGNMQPIVNDLEA